jgi:hypothetical protein
MSVNMWKIGRFAAWAAASVLAVSLAGCGGGGGNPGTSVLGSSGNNSSVQAMKVVPLAASANVGDVLSFSVNGGSGPYSFAVSNASIATLTSVSPGASPGTLRMDSAGSTSVTVTDATGQVQEVTLTVTQSAAQLRLSPTTLVLPETHRFGQAGESTNLMLTIFGGTAGFTAYSSDPVRVVVGVTGNKIQVSAGTSGTLCSTASVTRYSLDNTPVNDATQPASSDVFDVLITVVDSNGASANAKLVILDDGLNTNPTGNCR